MTPGATEKCSAPPSTVAAQYETLRLAALGEALPSEARSGLMLFLRRGLWGWARRLAPVSTGGEPTRAPSPGSTAPCEGKAVVHILAAMAMNTPKRSVL